MELEQKYELLNQQKAAQERNLARAESLKNEAINYKSQMVKRDK